jgi:tRNA(Ile2) C34 agmatinyltransferase TiaS
MSSKSFGKRIRASHPVCAGCGKRVAALGALGYCARCRAVAPTETITAEIKRRRGR